MVHGRAGGEFDPAFARGCSPFRVTCLAAGPKKKKLTCRIGVVLLVTLQAATSARRKHMTTFRSVCDAPGRVCAASGVGVEDTTRAGRRGSASGLCLEALPTSPRANVPAPDAIDATRTHDAVDAKERIKGP